MTTARNLATKIRLLPRPIPQFLLALLLGLTVSYYWSPWDRMEQDRQAASRQQAIPGVYLQTTRSWSFNELGALTNILEASSVKQFPRRDESLLEAPRFYAHSGDGRTWSATADRGRFQHRRQNLQLRSNVVLSHDQTGSRLETAAMDIMLEKKIAKSQQRVTITDEHSNTRAYGMIAYLETEKILLKPTVESIYAQPRP